MFFFCVQQGFHVYDPAFGHSLIAFAFHTVISVFFSIFNVFICRFYSAFSSFKEFTLSSVSSSDPVLAFKLLCNEELSFSNDLIVFFS